MPLDFNPERIQEIVRNIVGPVTNEEILRLRYEKLATDPKTGELGQYFFTTDGYWSTRRFNFNIVSIPTSTSATYKVGCAVLQPTAATYFGYGIGSINPDTQQQTELDDTNISTPYETDNEDFVFTSIRVGARNKFATYAGSVIGPQGTEVVSDPSILSSLGLSPSGALAPAFATMADVTGAFQPFMMDQGVTLEDTLMQAIAANSVVTLKWRDNVKSEYDVSPTNRLASFAGQSLYRSSGLPLSDNSKKFPEGWRWMNTGLMSKFSTIIQVPRPIVVPFLCATLPIDGSFHLPLSIGIDVQVHVEGVGFSIDPINQPMS